MGLESVNRKLDSAIVSPVLVVMDATPVRMDISYSESAITLDAKVVSVMWAELLIQPVMTCRDSVSAAAT